MPTSTSSSLVLLPPSPLPTSPPQKKPHPLSQERVHGGSLRWWVWVEDATNEHLYHAEPWTLTKKMAREGPQRLAFTIPIFEPLPPQYYIRVISDDWLQVGGGGGMAGGGGGRDGMGVGCRWGRGRAGVGGRGDRIPGGMTPGAVSSRVLSEEDEGGGRQQGGEDNQCPKYPSLQPQDPSALPPLPSPGIPQPNFFLLSLVMPNHPCCPMRHPLPPRPPPLLQAESLYEVSFAGLVLPQRMPPHTELLDLDPLPLSALGNEAYEAMYRGRFTHFNPIQTQVGVVCGVWWGGGGRGMSGIVCRVWGGVDQSCMQQCIPLQQC